MVNDGDGKTWNALWQAVRASGVTVDSAAGDTWQWHYQGRSGRAACAGSALIAALTLLDAGEARERALAREDERHERIETRGVLVPKALAID